MSRLRDACGRRAYVALVLLLLVGVAWMHTLASAPVPDRQPGMAAAMAAQAMAAQPCDAPHDAGECPDGGHGGDHAEAMCQSTAAEASRTADAPPMLSAPAPCPATQQRLTATVADEAARGSGCGPPSLHELAISRT